MAADIENNHTWKSEVSTGLVPRAEVQGAVIIPLYQVENCTSHKSPRNRDGNCAPRMRPPAETPEQKIKKKSFAGVFCCISLL